MGFRQAQSMNGLLNKMDLNDNGSYICPKVEMSLWWDEPKRQECITNELLNKMDLDVNRTYMSLKHKWITLRT